MRYGERGVSSEIQTVEKELQEKARSKPAVRAGQAKTAQACKKQLGKEHKASTGDILRERSGGV